MPEPLTFHHAIVTVATGNTITGLAFRRRTHWLFLPTGDGPVYVVQPTDHLQLLGELAPSVAPLAEAELRQRLGGVACA